MTYKEAAIVIGALEDRKHSEEFFRRKNKEDLDGMKVLFLDNRATEEDKKRAAELEEKIREEDFQIGVLQRHIEGIENAELIDRRYLDEGHIISAWKESKGC